MTVKKPRKIVVDLSDVFSGGIAYVMLSRIQNIEQLILVGGSHLDKVYPSEKALDELTNMLEKQFKPCNGKSLLPNELKIFGCNIRSLPAHQKDIILEPCISEADVILLQQTCLSKNDMENEFVINGFENHFVTIANGKGVVTHFSTGFRHVADVSEDQYQMTLIRSQGLDIVNVYRSSNSSCDAKKKFVQHLLYLLDFNKKVLITGDFNEDYPDSIISKELEDLGFIQHVILPTHIRGNLIDQVWTANVEHEKLILEHFPVYFTDHDAFFIKIDLS